MEKFMCILCDELKDSVSLCASDHISCTDCLQSAKQGARCKKCWTTFGAAQQNPINSKLRSECCNRAAGCQMRCTSREMAGHIGECAFRQVSCIGAKLGIWDCQWSQMPVNIMQHLHDAHRHQLGKMLPGKGTVKLAWNATERLANLKIIGSDLEHKFLCLYISDPAERELRVRLLVLGIGATAARYAFKMQVFVPADCFNEIKLETAVCSDAADADDILSADKCISFTHATVRRFLCAGGFFNFRYLIKRKSN